MTPCTRKDSDVVIKALTLNLLLSWHFAATHQEGMLTHMSKVTVAYFHDKFICRHLLSVSFNSMTEHSLRVAATRNCYSNFCTETMPRMYRPGRTQVRLEPKDTETGEGMKAVPLHSGCLAFKVLRSFEALMYFATMHTCKNDCQPKST